MLAQTPLTSLLFSSCSVFSLFRIMSIFCSSWGWLTTILELFMPPVSLCGI
jgi:hypothetical protein